jgi:outer membrane protein OmpA-like peptidoglycan-associated protein
MVLSMQNSEPTISPKSTTMQSFCKPLFVTLFASSIAITSFAQEKLGLPPSNFVRSYKGNSLTLKGGVTHPMTDIRSFEFGNGIQPGFGLSFNHMFSSAFGLQLNGGYDMLEGKSSSAAESMKLGFPEQVGFETNVIHASVTGYVNILNLATTLKKANQVGLHDRRFGLYAATGLGLVNFDSKITGTRNYSQPIIDDSLVVGEIGGVGRGISGSQTKLDIPLTIGVKYKISKMFDIGLENTIHFTQTDVLDAFNDNAAGNNNNNDKYMMTALALTYKFVPASQANADYVEWMDPLEVMYDDYQFMAERMRKLTTDTDNDGISDVFDKEPATPAGVKVDGSGVSMDVDNDGVPDAKDEDPFSPKGATVDANGKPTDTDVDGVPDVLDKEPTTPAGVLVNHEGRTIRQDFATGADLLPTIYFDHNSTALKTSYYPLLTNLAKYMKSYPNTLITITGNTDVSGSPAYNEKLGLKRAEAVKTFLTKYHQIDAARIATTTAGESDQVYKDHWLINRRVDIKLGLSNAVGTNGTTTPTTTENGAGDK